MSAPTLILGAGIAGLGAADALASAGRSFYLIEREDGPGGLIRTDTVGSFQFDRAGHFIHTRTSIFADAIRRTGIGLESLSRISSVLLDGSIIPYPFQFNLWAGPPALARDVQAELPRLSEKPDLSGGALAALGQIWGPSMTEAFFRPYMEKMWGRLFYDLPPDWTSRYMPARNLDLIKQGLIEPVLEYGYNSTFLYPESGRMGELAEALAAPYREKLVLNRSVVALDLGRRAVSLSDNSVMSFSNVISTVPLHRLLTMLGIEIQPNALSFSNLVNLRIGFRGEMLRNEHWYYVPDPSVPFFRAGIPSNVSRRHCPSGCNMLSLECGLGSEDAVERAPLALATEALDHLSDYGVLRYEAVEVVDAHLISPAYVANRMEVTPALQKVAADLSDAGVFIAGRYGAWDYLSLEEAYLSGISAGKLVCAAG